jgi:hypothetical protein
VTRIAVMGTVVELDGDEMTDDRITTRPRRLDRADHPGPSYQSTKELRGTLAHNLRKAAAAVPTG